MAGPENIKMGLMAAVQTLGDATTKAFDAVTEWAIEPARAKTEADVTNLAKAFQLMAERPQQPAPVVASGADAVHPSPLGNHVARAMVPREVYANNYQALAKAAQRARVLGTAPVEESAQQTTTTPTPSTRASH